MENEALCMVCIYVLQSTHKHTASFAVADVVVVSREIIDIVWILSSCSSTALRIRRLSR